MAKAVTNGPYKWIAGVLASLVLILAGAFLGEMRATAQLRVLAATLATHSGIDGHPVIVERVGSLADDIREMKDQLDRIEEKMDAYQREGGG